MRISNSNKVSLNLMVERIINMAFWEKKTSPNWLLPVLGSCSLNSDFFSKLIAFMRFNLVYNINIYVSSQLTPTKKKSWLETWIPHLLSRDILDKSPTKFKFIIIITFHNNYSSLLQHKQNLLQVKPHETILSKI